MTFNNKIVEKEFKKAKTKFYAGAALLVLTAVLLVVGLLNYASSKKNMAPLGEVIDGGNKINKLAYVDIYDFIQFASKGDDLGYYIGYDDDRYYIISISSSDYGYVVRQFNEAGKGNTFRLYGHTVSIPLEARGYAIEALNEAVGDTVVSVLNFDEVFGKVYLSVEKEAQNFSFDSLISVSGGYLLGGIFTLITGLTLFFVGRSQRKSFAANEGDGGLLDSEVMEQINREDTVWLE
ncbi:MAG: hypothetical protein IJI05_01225 [Erysipelotrichaceae bacterium]|nr:hypothetical protein [Erysipelotrichaceae bacterium]